MEGIFSRVAGETTTLAVRGTIGRNTDRLDLMGIVEMEETTGLRRGRGWMQ